MTEQVKVPKNSIEAEVEYLSKYLEGYVKGLQSSKEVNIEQVLTCLSELVSGLVSIKSNLSLVLQGAEEALCAQGTLNNEIKLLNDKIGDIQKENNLKLKELQKTQEDELNILRQDNDSKDSTIQSLLDDKINLQNTLNNLQNEYNDLQKDFESILNRGD